MNKFREEATLECNMLSLVILSDIQKTGKMKAAFQSEVMQAFGYTWNSSKSRDTDVCRGLVHCGSRDCLMEFFQKLIDTGAVSCKYYVVFHVVPMVLRLRKAKNIKHGLKILGKSMYEYFRSICFMAFLVGLLRGGLCVNWNQSYEKLNSFFDAVLVSSPFSASSILFEDSSRRNEITNYVSAKAVRSVYLMMKRTLRLPFKDQVYMMHMAAMAILYYVYNHMPGTLKFRNLFALIFGDD